MQRAIKKYTFTIEGRLPGLNEYTAAQRRNKYGGASFKKKNQHICEVYIKRSLRNLQITNPVFIRYLWVESNRKRDLDNITSFGHKIIQDALVTTGVLKDDGWNEIIGYSDEFKVDKENPRIEVVIEEQIDER